MGVNYFTDEQVEVLRKNPYVKNVSNKSITYTEEFKMYFHNKYLNRCGPTKIFSDAGFDINVLGKTRIQSFASRNKSDSKRLDGFKDTRKGKSGRPSTKELTDKELIERLKHKNQILAQENDFLKRVRFINKQQILKASKTKNQKTSSN